MGQVYIGIVAIIFVLIFLRYILYYPEIQLEKELKKIFKQLTDRRPMPVPLKVWGKLYNRSAFKGLIFEWRLGNAIYYGKVIRKNEKSVLVKIWTLEGPMYKVWVEYINDQENPKLYFDSGLKYRVPNLKGE